MAEPRKTQQNTSENTSQNIPLSPVFEYDVTIIEIHLDTFGHVNNTTYLQLFEAARWELMTARGYGLKRVIELGQGPVILEVNMKFRHELRNRERIKIKSWVTMNSGKIGTLRQVMVNEKGEDACTADFVYGLFDLKTRKLIEPTEAWKSGIGLT
jgi:thioesterase-3